MTFAYDLSGPDDDGLMWMEWTDDEGVHSINLGTWEEAHPRLMAILGEDPALAEFRPPS